MIHILDDARPEPTQDESLVADFRQFCWLKKSITAYQLEQDRLKARLLSELEEHGEVDEKGHAYAYFPEPVEGYDRLQRQRRVSHKVDDNAVEEILTAKGVRDKCFKLVEVLDEDAVMGLLYEGILSEADIDTMFPKTVSYAFVPVKA